MTILIIFIIILVCAMAFCSGILLAIMLYNFNESFRNMVNRWADNINQKGAKP